jgi:DNA-binding IclR family transcriptional regulator
MAEMKRGHGRSELAAVKSAKRMLEVIEFFAKRRAPASVGEIAKALGYPQSSTSVLMKFLHNLKYMQHDPVHRLYRPTLRVALTSSWLSEEQLSGTELTALMTDLRVRTGGSVVRGIQNDIDLQYIQVVGANSPIQLVMRIGQLRPLGRTAVGKVLLAQHDDERVEATWLEPAPRLRRHYFGSWRRARPDGAPA